MATSETSARVGIGLSIMLSSIWVATITGLAAARQSRPSRFWIGGTFCTGSSTPRSPRAIMMPSETARMASKVRTAAGFSIFDRIAARPAHQAPRLLHVGGALHEAQRQPVDAELADELQIVPVLVRQRLERQQHVGDVDPLAVRDGAADHNLALREVGAALDHLEPDLAVVHQEGRAGLEHAQDLGMRQLHPPLVPRHVVEIHPERRAHGELGRPLGEDPDPELGALEIGEDRDGPPGVGLDLADDGVARGDLVVRAVGHVEPEDVGAGLEQGGDRRAFARRRGRAWPRS